MIYEIPFGYTHTLIWTLESAKLSSEAASAIYDGSNTIYVSPIAFWEICMKIACGKLCLGDIRPESFPKVCQDCGFELLTLDADDASTFHELAGNHHKDPFDRILIWQSIRHDLNFITNDKNILKYVSEGLSVVW